MYPQALRMVSHDAVDGMIIMLAFCCLLDVKILLFDRHFVIDLFC